MSVPRIFTVLAAAGAALANPIAKPVAEADPSAADYNLGPGIPTGADIVLTSVSYFGDGCPKDSLKGEFCPETTSFNVTFLDLKAILQDWQPSADANCHIEVGFKTENAVQLNLLQGDFIGSVYLEEAGMTALAHTSVSFADNTGGTNIPWLWEGPVDAIAVYEHNLIAAFVSECSQTGEFLMLIDIVLQVTRGSASDDAIGFVDIDELTGAISQAYVIKTCECGKTLPTPPPKSESSKSGGGYGKEKAKKKKEEEAKKKVGGSGSASGTSSPGPDNNYGHKLPKHRDCGHKCTYTPGISAADELEKVSKLSEEDQDEYYENKANYEKAKAKGNNSGVGGQGSGYGSGGGQGSGYGSGGGQGSGKGEGQGSGYGSGGGQGSGHGSGGGEGSGKGEGQGSGYGSGGGQGSGYGSGGGQGSGYGSGGGQGSGYGSGKGEGAGTGSGNGGGQDTVNGQGEGKGTGSGSVSIKCKRGEVDCPEKSG